MIGKAPRYTTSKYFVAKPDWHMMKEAPDWLKEEFEEDMNAEELSVQYKESNPEMKNPYYTWEGKIIDKQG